jgi:hypothetical protein
LSSDTEAPARACQRFGKLGRGQVGGEQKDNKKPSERKNKPSSAPKFTISDVLADPI